MARKNKFSKNWRKAKVRITKLHSKIANIRKDFLHQSSKDISKNHAIVFVEDLQVKNMSASSKGTKAKPGKRVAQKSTRRSGTPAFWCPCHHKTPIGSVLRAGTPQHRTARRKRRSLVCSAGSQSTR